MKSGPFQDPLITAQATHSALISSGSTAGSSGYEFFIGTLLTVATLGVTCVAVVIAILAFVGYNGLRNLAKTESKKHTEKAVADYLRGDEFKELIKKAAEANAHEKTRDKISLPSSEASKESLDSQGKEELF